MSEIQNCRSLVIGIWVLSLDLAQDGGESFDLAQDREPVERLVEPFVICHLELNVINFSWEWLSSHGRKSLDSHNRQSRLEAAPTIKII